MTTKKAGIAITVVPALGGDMVCFRLIVDGKIIGTYPIKKINHRDFARLKGRKGVVFETFEVPDVKES